MIKLIKRLLGRKTLLVLGVCYSLFLTFLLLFPSTNVPEVNVPSFDKIGHTAVFFILVILWLLYFAVKNKTNSYKGVWVVGSIFVYGIIIEVLQGLFFVTRTADLFDVLANTLGIFLGWLLFQKIKSRIVF